MFLLNSGCSLQFPLHCFEFQFDHETKLRVMTWPMVSELQGCQGFFSLIKANEMAKRIKVDPCASCFKLESERPPVEFNTKSALDVCPGSEWSLSLFSWLNGVRIIGSTSSVMRWSSVSSPCWWLRHSQSVRLLWNLPHCFLSSCCCYPCLL